jgi:hypothetical protein
MACHLCYIYHQHNQNWETVMCFTLGLTLTFLHQHLLMIKSTPMMIQSQTLSLKMPFSEKYHTTCLPPDNAFQVHLSSQMNKQRGNDLIIFDEVIQCVKAHAIHYNMDYTTLQILSRKLLLQLLTKHYQLNFLKPTLHLVPLTDRSVATVPIFDAKALLIAFLMIP